ncbi:hypothetical protein V1508DRAFT_421149 [Lipomyces doorenjongii]|uniref:uncharacterized protein n=1 Tax=Lipomyces doorenjongii TaxID=383834 RepID=UPI0034CF2CBA
MRRISRPQDSWSWCRLVVLLLLASPSLAENTFTFCSSQNTGSGYQAVYDIYQSYGACMSTCQSGYALAILQDFQCWCSNEAPGDTTSVSSCSVDSCPGYPSDPCGNLIEGLYGYILISRPSGTVSASVASTASSDSLTKTVPSSHSSTSSSEPPTSSTEASSTGYTSTSSRLTTSSTSSSSFSSTSTSATSNLATSTSSTISSSSMDTTTQSLIVSVVTVAGGTETLVITQTVSTATPTSSSSLATANVGSSTTGTTQSTSHSSSSFWDNKGKVAGTFVAVGIVALLLLLVLVFLIRRRRRHYDDDEPAADKAPHTPPMNDLPLAKFGLSSNGRHRSAATTGAGATMLDSEKQPSAVAAAGYGGAYSAPPPGSDRFQVDQRIDPGTMYVQYHDNYSRGSLRDEYDYSRRVLKILNPDDE